jgi:hypothetical protein
MAISERSLTLKVRISTLWIFMDFALLLLLTLNSLDPSGGMKEMIASFPSQLVPEVLLGGAILILIPFVLAFLSLTMQDSSNRRANLILGLAFAVFQFSGVAYALTRLAIQYLYLLFLQTAAFVASVLIVWSAYRWLKE